MGLDIMMPSDAQILINTHYGNEANETWGEDVFQDCNTEPIVKPDLNKNIFSYNYSPPEGNNRAKHYIFGLGVVILILLITIIVIETSGHHVGMQQLESSGNSGGGKFKLELLDHDLSQRNIELS